MGGRGGDSQGKRGEKAPKAITLSKKKAEALRAEMGQTGTEAGSAHAPWHEKVYVATSKSFAINSELDRYPEGDLSANTKAAAAQIDSGMKPLPANVKLTRYENSWTTLQTLGFKAEDNVSMESLASLSKQELKDLFMGRTRARQAYISTSYNKDANVFKSRDVRIEFTAKQGTHAIITDNENESEILLGRGYDQRVTGARMTKDPWGEPILVLKVEIDPSNRSKWFELP